MKKTIIKTTGPAIFFTIAILIIWQVTGGDYYTKFEVIEQVEAELDPSDPLVAAGFYDGDTHTETITTKSFRLGLLPTPSGFYDKHLVSVMSLLFITWSITLIFGWLSFRKYRLSRRVM